jgi:PAS domain S-box-containing protein
MNSDATVFSRGTPRRDSGGTAEFRAYQEWSDFGEAKTRALVRSDTGEDCHTGGDMANTVLCVDDDPSILAAYRKFLEPAYAATTATRGSEALVVMATRGPFAVVVSDLQMPDLDGVELLSVIRELYPDTVRMLLTGNLDIEHALKAVNDGHVFRFLTKPCSPTTLKAAVGAATAQYELILSDRRRIETALRESEERYRQLFDGNPHPMWVYERNTHKFLAVNEAAIRHYGYTRDEFLKMRMTDIAPDAPLLTQPVALSNHGPIHRHRHKSGEERMVEVAANPIEFGGHAAHFVLIVDVTERKLLEDQLKQAQKLESIGQLAAGIAHEINTPIQYIGDNTNFLAGAFRDVGDILTLYRTAGGDPAKITEAELAANHADLDYLLEEAPRAIGQTLEGVKHVARIVKAMKEFAHPGTDEKIPIDLNHALETVIAVARNEWKYTAEVVTDFDPVLPQVPGLAGELNQVFLNLLVNAAHAVQSATRADGRKGTITLSTRRLDNVVEVRVTDTGCGIPETIRGRIFDPFFTTKPVGQGTGQGLAITHAAVVKRHGGVITFESEVGEGTTFIVRLPLDGVRLTHSEFVKAVNTQRKPSTHSTEGT